MGDIQSEEERDILIEMTLPAVTNPSSDEVVKGNLSYFNVISSSLETVECSLTLERNS